ncbi:hypothetical protein L5515_009272 [Caenorhabditis briggsae]|uniref:Serpentine Receptor, class H n=1 Tax=Caenorhabditis briggsae TaxID=6238 RepID=A0AAE9F8E6_CAEBR|nr:hypothetical protein L5515_009272 [Caenorhabditis briggsae]
MSSSEVSYLSSPEFYSLSLYILGCIAFPIHLFGAWCILVETPETMKRVKWAMFNLHSWGCSLDLLLGILGQPFIVPPVFGGAPLGLLHLFGVDPGIQVYLMVTLMNMVAISTGAIFENRFYILFAEKTWWRYVRYPYYITNVALAFLYYVPTMIDIPDQTLAREWIFEHHPEVKRFDSPDHPIYVVAYNVPDPDWIRVRMIISVTIMVTESLTFFFLLRWQMKKATKLMTMSEKTLAAQKAFLKAINMQIAIPASVIGTPQILLIFIGYFGWNTSELNSFAYVVMSIHGASATLVMLYCHHAYREYCKGLLRGKLSGLKTLNRWSPFVSVTSSDRHRGVQ